MLRKKAVRDQPESLFPPQCSYVKFEQQSQRLVRCERPATDPAGLYCLEHARRLWLRLKRK